MAVPAAFATSAKKFTPLDLVRAADYKVWLKKQSAPARMWLENAIKEAKSGTHALLPANDGSIKRVVAIVSDTPTLWDIAGLPYTLPIGNYRVESASGIDSEALFRLSLGWGLGAYKFTRYRAAKRAPATLVVPEGVNAALLNAMVEAQSLGRDLINTPADDLGPPELAQAAVDLAKRHGVKARVVKGEALLRENFPLVHAVGRAANKPPHLIDFSWGNAKHPTVTLVGKGVTFDTGGLDIKNASGMYHMKKDMGGAAGVLAIAHMIMAVKLPVRLRVIITAVENAIGPNAMRPRDIVKSRQGMTVEIQNTDAEGRLILADALALAAEESPDYLINMATLTGSKLPLLGMDIGAVFTNSDESYEGLKVAAATMNDPLWQIPIWQDYASRLESNIADTLSCTDGYADPILAAIFMQKFAVPKKSKTRWLHIDVMCMNMANRPGRPEGGDTQGARAIFWWLRESFGSK